MPHAGIGLGVARAVEPYISELQFGVKRLAELAKTVKDMQAAFGRRPLASPQRRRREAGPRRRSPTATKR